MEAELADIRQFLSAHAPFDQLGEAEIETVARALTIRYLRRGSAFPPAEVAPALYLFRTGAAELRGTEHQLLDRLEEGDLFADACTNSSAGDTITGLVVEDSLGYTLDCPTLGTLREQSRTLDDYLDDNVSKRLRRALRRLQEATRGNLDFAELRARELMPTRDVCIEHDASIRAAGEKMMTQKTSGLLVMDNGRLAGLVTDHDLRKHCIVGTLSPDAEVREIMTTALYSIAPETPAFSALMEMTRRNIRHLPVVESGTPAGLLTATDFLRQQAARSVYIVSDIERCRTSDDVARACQALPEVQLQLVASGASAAHVQQAVAAIADAATRKLIQLAIDELGAAPVPFAWAAVGSQSRREMAAGSDQA